MTVHLKIRFDILNFNFQMVASQQYANNYNVYSVLYCDTLLATFIKNHFISIIRVTIFDNIPILKNRIHLRVGAW